MDLRPTARELRWFAQIDRHGPQSSEFFYALTRETHRCKDTALRRLQALRKAKYLCLPPQQCQIAKADFNPYVYDLTKLGWDVLADHQDLERHCRPTGHWWHGAWTSALSSGIEIGARCAGLTYVPIARILAIKDAPLAIPLAKGQLIPDQLFAIKYPDGYRAFAVEMDRGTEPYRSEAARKSLYGMLKRYADLNAQDALRRHYGLKSPVLLLLAFTCCRRAARCLEYIERLPAAFAQIALVAVVPGQFPRFAPIQKTLSQPWMRAGTAPLGIFAA